MKRIAVLGSSGSIGTQTLDVCRQHADKLSVTALAVGHRVSVLADQAVEFGVKNCAVGAEELKGHASAPEGCRFGFQAVLDLIFADDVDIVVNSLVGAAGLRVSYETLRAGKVLALANKESLVVGGDLIMPLAAQLDASAGHVGSLMPIEAVGDSFRWSVSRQETQRFEGCHTRSSACASNMEYGREDKH